MRKWILVACVLLLPVGALAQPIASGVLRAADDTVSAQPTAGVPSIGVQISGTWEGTITFQGTSDGSNYVSLQATSQASGSAGTTTTANGIFAVFNPGLMVVRVNATAWTSGTATVVFVRGGSSGGGGGGSSGPTADVNLIEVGGAAIALGQAAMAASVPVAIASNQGAVPASQSGTWTVQPGNTANTTAWLVAGGLTADGAAAAGNRIGTLPAIVETGTLPTLTDGRNASLYVNTNGGLFVAPTSGSFATDTTQDSAASTTGPQVMAFAVQDGSLPSAVTAGDAVRVASNLQGVVYTRSVDPCSGAKTVIPINISTATTTELTSSLSGASNYYYVCSINLGPTAGAQNFALVDDDSDNCASVTSGMAGGTTAGSGWNFAANGGLTFGNGMGTIFKTNGTNRVICAVTSAAVQISGAITVVAAP